MAPVLQRAIAVAVGILLRLLFLGQVTVVVGGHLSHVWQIIRLIFGGIPAWVLFQDFNNLSSAVKSQHQPETHQYLDRQERSNSNWQQSCYGREPDLS